MTTDTIDLADPALLTAHLADELAAAARTCEDIADRRATAALGITLGVPGAEGRYKILSGEYEGALAAVRRLGQARKGAQAHQSNLTAQTAHDAEHKRRQSIDDLVNDRRAVIARVEKQMRGLASNLKQADELAERIVELRGPVPDFPSNVHPEGLGPVPARERIRRAAVGLGLGQWLGIKPAFIDATRPVSSLIALEDDAMAFSALSRDGKQSKAAAA